MPFELDLEYLEFLLLRDSWRKLSLFRFDPSFDEEEVFDPSSPLHNKTGSRQRRARFTSSRRHQRPESRSFEQQQTDFSAHFVPADDLFKQFFGTKDPFESIFNHHDRMFQHHHPGFFEGIVKNKP